MSLFSKVRSVVIFFVSRRSKGHETLSLGPVSGERSANHLVKVAPSAGWTARSRTIDFALAGADSRARSPGPHRRPRPYWLTRSAARRGWPPIPPASGRRSAKRSPASFPVRAAVAALRRSLLVATDLDPSRPMLIAEGKTAGRPSSPLHIIFAAISVTNNNERDFAGLDFVNPIREGAR